MGFFMKKTDHNIAIKLLEQRVFMLEQKRKFNQNVMAGLRGRVGEAPEDEHAALSHSYNIAKQSSVECTNEIEALNVSIDVLKVDASASWVLGVPHETG